MIKNILFIMFIVLCVFVFFKLKTYTESQYLDVQFEDMEPVSKTVPVYLKGVKVGKVKKTMLTPDIDYSVVRLEVFKKYKLPIGTKAKLKYDKLSKEYISLEVPNKPYFGYLTNNDVIQGSAVKNLRKVLEDQIEKGNVNSLVNNATEGLDNIIEAADKINIAADLIVDIIKDNRPEIDKIIQNFAKASEDTSLIISDLRGTLKDEQVRADIKGMAKSLAASAKNIEQTTSNPKIESTIDNFKQASQNLNQASVNLKSSSTKADYILCKTDKLIDNTNITMDSVEYTSEGIREVLSKNFLIFRLMFGRPGESMAK